jgi:beta-N-acetylhexosaminidase
MKPFAAAIAGGIGMIMTSHILFRELDNTCPATLSPRIIKELLREELGFHGVIVSDDIGMRAVSSMFEDRDAAVRFLLAGNDMLMICAHWTDTERARVLARAILEARRSGELDCQTLERSHERIDTMLNHTAQHAVRKLPDDTFRRNAAAGPLFSSETVEVI